MSLAYLILTDYCLCSKRLDTYVINEYSWLFFKILNISAERNFSRARCKLPSLTAML